MTGVTISRATAARLALAGAVLLSLALLPLYVRVAGHYPRTADQINYVFAGIDAAQGNWRLLDWRMTSTNFLTSDVALTAIVVAVAGAFGVSPTAPALLLWLPAIIWWLLVMTAAAVIVLFRPDRRARTAGIAIIAATLAFPLMRDEEMHFITLSAIHIGTIGYALSAFLCATGALHARSRRAFAAWCAGLFIVLLAGCFGDDLLLFVGALPMAALFLVSDVPPARRIAVVGVAAMAAVAAKLLLILNAATGGFVMAFPPTRFARFEDLFQNVSISIRSVFVWFSSNFFGREVRDAIPELLHLPLLLAAVIVAADAMRRIFHRRPIDPDRRVATLSLLLVAAAAINLAALVFSDRIALENNPVAAARYLMPLWVYLAVLLALNRTWSWRLLPVAVLALAVTIVTNWPIYATRGTTPIEPWQQAITQRLIQEGMDFGLTSYWDSGVIDFASGGKIQTAYMSTWPDGQLRPQVQIHKNYHLPDLARTDFFVLVPRPPQTFTEDDILKALGRETERFATDRYTVLLYRRGSP
ncbi:MAG: hypothetical protein M9932_04740 [Xanthobacteraceae bacterium]|nr:hypothetical protein [Xanthobacteraceae bacterium]